VRSAGPRKQVAWDHGSAAACRILCNHGAEQRISQPAHRHLLLLRWAPTGNNCTHPGSGEVLCEYMPAQGARQHGANAAVVLTQLGAHLMQRMCAWCV
jgi:hypothetical protein